MYSVNEMTKDSTSASHSFRCLIPFCDRTILTVPLRLVAARLVTVARPIAVVLTPDRMVLLVAILLILQIGQRWGVDHLGGGRQTVHAVRF